MKRTISALLVLLLIMSIMQPGIPVHASTSGVGEDGLRWSVDGNTLTITGTGKMKNYSADWVGHSPWRSFPGITRVYISEGITHIGAAAFYDLNNIVEVSLPSTLTSIGGLAFARCTDLKQIEIPSSVTRIGNNAFEDCLFLENILIPSGVTVVEFRTFSACGALREVILPEGITSIGNFAFYKCGALENIEIPKTVETIGHRAFAMCSFSEIHIPASVNKLSDRIFEDVTELRNIYFYGDAPAFDPNTLCNVKAVAYYPSDNATWTESVRQSYGGTIIWVPLGHKHNYSVTVVPAACETQGYTTHTCSDCGYTYNDSYTSILMHDPTPVSCAAPSICQREGCGKTVKPALPHTWDDAFAEIRTCGVCGHVDEHTHNFSSFTAEPSCTNQGYTTHTCKICLKTYKDAYVDSTGHAFGDPVVAREPSCELPGLEDRTCTNCGYFKRTETEKLPHSWKDPNANLKECTVCGHTEGGYRVDIEDATLEGALCVWVDGQEYSVIRQGTANGVNTYVIIDSPDATNMVTYTFNDPTAKDIHTQYPVGMKVWILERNGDGYVAKRVKELDNLLQYSGSSIRIAGVKGIRMITSVPQKSKSALTGKGLAGYTLVEYGTALAWASDLDEDNPLTLGQPYTKSNYAYKKDVADPIFANKNGMIQYTNVLVGFSLDQCKDDIAMRPYIILEDTAGKQTTLYGGIIYRSIGYIAYQNRNVFKTSSGAYGYVWEIIHHVYGNKYDKDYKG